MAMKHKTVLVLAAGMGSRYGGLKQVDPMGPHGEAVLDYSVYDAMRAGFTKVVFVIREELLDAFREQIEPRVPAKMTVDYAFQRLDDVPDGFQIPADRQKPWGTAHAVYAAREVIDEPFAVINADDFYGHDAYATMGEWLDQPAANDRPYAYSMVGYRLDNTLSEHGAVNRGICTADNNNLLQQVEEVLEIASNSEGIIVGTGQDGQSTELDPAAICSMNFWGMHPSIFAEIDGIFGQFLQQRGNEPKSELYIPTVFDALISDKLATCAVLPTYSHWFGVTYPEDKPSVVSSIRCLIDAGEYPESLAQ